MNIETNLFSEINKFIDVCSIPKQLQKLVF